MGFQMTKSLQQDTRVKLDPTIFRHAFSYVQSDEKWLPTQSVSLGYRPFFKKKKSRRVYLKFSKVLQLKWASGGMYLTGVSPVPPLNY